MPCSVSRDVRALVLCAVVLAACSADEPTTPSDAATSDMDSSKEGAGPKADAGSESSADISSEPDAGVDPEDGGPTSDVDLGTIVHFCELPGSVRNEGTTTITVPGGGSGPAKLAFLRIPSGFCAHYFGNVGNTRQLRFAPNGDLFVASPTQATTSGGGGGLSAILILPDDDKDGLADGQITFLSPIPATQGILFANDHFYYQDDSLIRRVPYITGDRAPSGPSELVADITPFFKSAIHWPKPLDQADDGTIYVGNGSDQGEACNTTARPFVGGILKLDGSPSGKPVSKGFRNPIAIRCQRGHNLCFAAELSMDYQAGQGGREKLVPIREGDDWGYPCCATKDLPYLFDVINVIPDCSLITPEDVSFIVGDTPFTFDFERGKWPAPYTNSIFVPLHGSAGGWIGARLVAIAVDPVTGFPKPGTNLGGTSSGAMTDFATGWESHTHGRPTVVEFAADGRMFLGNDTDGEIFWIAPLDLTR